LHPRVIGMRAVINEYKNLFAQRRLRFPMISLLTNGVTLRRQMSSKLVELEVVDLVRFSVDGGSREKFEEIRKGVRWDVIVRNIQDFVEVNQGRCETGIICVIEYGRKKTVEWMTPELREPLTLVDHVELRYPHDFIGNVAVPSLPPKAFQRRCYFLDHSMVVLPNGDVTVCCVDLNGKGTIGDLGQKDLRQIYTTKKRLEMIGHLKRGERDKVDLCKNCSGYGY
jgi:radical SAM protein with 4Fe4S-binding SPASM domain